MTRLKPGQSWQTDSFLGHTFVAEAVDGTVHKIFSTNYPQGEITISRKDISNDF